MRRAHSLCREDGDLVVGDFVLLADTREACEGLGDECYGGEGELEFDFAWFAGVEGVVEGDAGALTVYGG